MQITQQTAGNGVVSNRAYDPNTGLVQTIQAGAGNAVANLSFAFNAIGTLTSRGDATQSLTETFTYDNMNRLTNYDIAGGSSKTVGYDPLGNITSKSDVGTYAYPTGGSPRPHAIGSITGTINTIFTYDANGNMIAGQGRTVTYTAFNMADTITQGTATVAFVYDANHARIKQTAPDGTTIYVAGPVGVERFAATSGLVQWNEYLRAGSALVGVHFSRSDATQATRHFITDHLGSVAVLTDEMGAVVERLSYDAWGKRRFANGADDTAGSITSQTTKGFTGQEHIPSTGLINMNARIYDPVIGRFMTPDSVVQDVYLSQILNRYGYCGNNPLSFTDPSGHLFLVDDLIIIAIVLILAPIIRDIPILGSIIQIGAAIVCGPCAASASAAITGINGGDFGDIVKAYVLTLAEQAAFSAAGDFVGAGDTAADVAERFVVHGAVGGTFSALRGGDFGSGFLAAGVSSLGHGVNLGGKAANTAFRAVLGGIGSVAGGGKFADGAITGAFAYLFNDGVHSQRQQLVKISIGYKPIGSFDGEIYYHTFVEITLGSDYYILRGGPSEDPWFYGMSDASVDYSGSGSSGFGLGEIIVHTGADALRAEAAGNAPTYWQTIGHTSLSWTESVDALNSFARSINDAHFSYYPVSQNSNSVAFQAVTVFGIARPHRYLDDGYLAMKHSSGASESMVDARYIVIALLLTFGIVGVVMGSSPPRKQSSDCVHAANVAISEQVRVGQPFAEVLAFLQQRVEEFAVEYPDQRTARTISARSLEGAGDGRGAKLVIGSERKLNSIIVAEIELLELRFDGDGNLARKSCSLAYTGP